MEKRLFLAILLSFCVLYGWSALVATPSKNIVKKQSDSSIEIKKESFPEQNSSSLPPIQEQKAENLAIVETDQIKAVFTNIGGVLDGIFLKEYQKPLPISDLVNLFGYDKNIFTLAKKSDGEIVYIFEDESLKITKAYKLNKCEIRLSIEIEKKKEHSKLDNINFKIYSIKMSNFKSKIKDEKFFMQERSFFEYVINSKDGFVRKNNAFQFSAKERMQKTTNVTWIGFRDRYLCGIIKPLFSSNGFSIIPMDKERLEIDLEAKKTEKKYEFLMFFGPEDVSILEKIEKSFKEIKRYYRNDFFDAIAKFIDFLMRNIYKIVPNWGLAIILIGLVVYFSMYPLTLQSFSSMRKMQKIQPKIANLKEKYKNNPQKMNQEMMEIYKEEKINPLGGCLPLLLQMPVFIGLYQVLWRNVSLKGASFLWIKDLSAPDRLFLFKQNLPFIGNEINILPILMIFVMFIQQKISMKTMVLSDPDQIAQQKMMSIIFPIMLGFIFYHMASGLNLYFTLFYLLSAFTQWKMSKKS